MLLSSVNQPCVNVRGGGNGGGGSVSPAPPRDASLDPSPKTSDLSDHEAPVHIVPTIKGGLCWAHFLNILLNIRGGVFFCPPSQVASVEYW